MKNDSPFLQAYLNQVAHQIYGQHLTTTNDLAAAFIARHGIDPTDAVVVTHFDEETMTWTSRIERKKDGTD